MSQCFFVLSGGTRAFWLATHLLGLSSHTTRNSTPPPVGHAKSTTPGKRSTHLRCLMWMALASSTIHVTTGSTLGSSLSASKITWGSTAPTLWHAKSLSRSEPGELGRWPLGDGGQYLPSPHEATPSPLSILSGDLDFGIFQFFTRLCWWWDLNPNTYTPGFGISSEFVSLEYHQNLSLLEHHRTLPFFGGRSTMVPAPPRGAPPTLNEPSGLPPPLLQVTPPSPPFLAALSFGMSLREWRHAGFLFLLLGATRASGSPVTDTRGTLDDYFAMKNIVETSNACELPGVSIKYGPFLECMWRAVEKGFVDQSKASFVAEGLKSGFMAGVDVTKLRGHRWFKNYPPALEARRAVTKANNKRVGAFKTYLKLWRLAFGLPV